MMKDFLSGAFPILLTALTKRLDQGGHYKALVGDKLTTADFLFASIFFSVIHNDQRVPETEIIRQVYFKFESVEKYAQNLKAELGEYLEQRPKRAR